MGLTIIIYSMPTRSYVRMCSGRVEFILTLSKKKWGGKERENVFTVVIARL